MTKVSIIYPSDPMGKKVGGAETFVNNLIKFAPQDFKIEYIGITSDNNTRPSRKWGRLELGQKEFDFYPICYEREENRKKIFPLSLYFTLILKYSRLNLKDKVIVFNRIEPALFLQSVKTPKIGIIHNDIYTQMFCGNSEILWSKFPWLYFKIERFIFKSLDYIYSVSKESIEFYKKKYYSQKEKFSFLPTCIDTNIFSPSQRDKNVLRETGIFKEGKISRYKNIVLFVGRLQKQKAPLRLINAFYEFQKIHPESCFIIIGDGNLMSDTIKHIRNLKIERNIFLLGPIDNKDIVDYYRIADVLLLASNYEGFPMCILEALACGLPVVTTNVGEVKKVVKNGFSGEVVENFEPLTIAEALGKVVSNPGIYLKENCTSCIFEYTPAKVLEPVYKKIKELYNSAILR